MKNLLAGLVVMFFLVSFGCGGSGGGSDTGGSSNVSSGTGTAGNNSSTGGSTGDVAGSGSSTGTSGTDSTTASPTDSGSSAGGTAGSDAGSITGSTGGDPGTVEPPAVKLPSAPSEVAAQPGDGRVSVTWKGVADATSYNLYWGTSAGVTPSSANKKEGVTSPCVLTGFTNWTAYYFVMTAVNASGESTVSNETSTIPMALFDVGMIAGRTFDYSLTTGATGRVTFSADGTFSGQNHTASSPFGGNWVVRNGILLCLYTGGIMETMMLKESTPTSFVFTYAVTFADGSNGSPVEGTFVQAE